MKIRQHHTAADFLAACQLYLEREEAKNNLMIGIALAIDKRGEESEPFIAFTIESDGQPVFCGFQTPPDNLMMYGEIAHIEKAAILTSEFLKSQKAEIPGVIGPEYVTSPFCAAWSRHLNVRLHVEIETMVYVLTNVEAIRETSGKLIEATQEHVEDVARFLQGFHEDVPEIPLRDIRKTAEDKIRNGNIYLWQDEKIVSMAATARPTRNGITINLVYTPPEFRGKGYASNCCAALSQKMLDTGYDFCTLFADSKNPTSNKIYRNMGYEEVSAFSHIKFR